MFTFFGVHVSKTEEETGRSGMRLVVKIPSKNSESLCTAREWLDKKYPDGEYRLCRMILGKEKDQYDDCHQSKNFED